MMRPIVSAMSERKVNPLSLEVGCGWSRKHPVRLDFSAGTAANVIGDAANLPFRDGSFLLVYSSFVFEHLQNPQIALGEWKRVLQRSGCVEIITDNASHWRFHVHFPRWLRLVNSHQDYQGSSERDKHFALYLPMHLKNHLYQTGFKNIQLYFYNVFPLSWPFKWLGLGAIAAASVKATAFFDSSEDYN